MQRGGMLPLLLPLLPLLLLLGTRVTEAATAVVKDVPPGGAVKTDLLSLEQEIGGNPTEAAQETHRNVRSFLFGSGIGIGVGPTWINAGYGTGYGYGYPGYPSYGYYNSPYYGYYPGFYKNIIIG